ncbi:Rho Gtpase-Activating Protein 22 [Manis pentadactyla]|nr:Rho Gtpase-Activating Protein 22 [Manis pentadactyla]
MEQPAPGTASGIHDPTTLCWDVREKEPQSHHSLQCYHEELGARRPFNVPKSRGQSVLNEGAPGTLLCSGQHRREQRSYPGTLRAGSRLQGPDVTDLSPVPTSPGVASLKIQVADGSEMDTERAKQTEAAEGLLTAGASQEDGTHFSKLLPEVYLARITCLTSLNYLGTLALLRQIVSAPRTDPPTRKVLRSRCLAGKQQLKQFQVHGHLLQSASTTPSRKRDLDIVGEENK